MGKKPGPLGPRCPLTPGKYLAPALTLFSPLSICAAAWLVCDSGRSGRPGGTRWPVPSVMQRAENFEQDKKENNHSGLSVTRCMTRDTEQKKRETYSASLIYDDMGAALAVPHALVTTILLYHR